MDNKKFFENIEYSINQVREDAYKEGYVAGNKDKAFDPYGFENINFSLDLSEPVKVVIHSDDESLIEPFKRWVV